MTKIERVYDGMIVADPADDPAEHCKKLFEEVIEKLEKRHEEIMKDVQITDLDGDGESFYKMCEYEQGGVQYAIDLLEEYITDTEEGDRREQ